MVPNSSRRYLVYEPPVISHKINGTDGPLIDGYHLKQIAEMEQKGANQVELQTVFPESFESVFPIAGTSTDQKRKSDRSCLRLALATQHHPGIRAPDSRH